MLDEAIHCRLWERMAAHYGNTWTNAYGADPFGTAGREWRKELGDLSRDQLRQGVRACLQQGECWPPSLPQFRYRCLGIPSFAHVDWELRTRKRGDNTGRVSGFARMVWQYVDTDAIRSASPERAESLLKRAYELACADRRNGIACPPEPAAEIEFQQAKASPPKPADPEHARAMQESIMSMLEIPRPGNRHAGTETHTPEVG